MTRRTGLVLTGGGARGAYQAGVLLGISEILGCSRTLPFPILSGASAGSISAAYLGSRADDFDAATRELFDLWGKLQPGDVFRTDAASLARIGVDWVADLGFGAWIGTGRGKSLLDTAPLRGYLGKHLDSDALRAHVLAGRLDGVAITATNYATGQAVTFFDGDPSITDWTRASRISKRDLLTCDHVLASAAIPVFFPAVELHGDYYADGCIRLSTPLGPVIHMGAERVLAIGVRHQRSAVQERRDLAATEHHGYPTTAETAGVLLNALFLDSLESDIERMQRVNQTLSMIPPEMLASRRYELRSIPVLMVSPSQDLGAIATQVIDRLPYMVRHFLRGLGASNRSGWDLVSYLAFDSGYTTRLLDLGYEDALAQRETLLRFLVD